jgi:hypothetical protein
MTPNGDAFVKPSLAMGVLPEILTELLAARKRCVRLRLRGGAVDGMDGRPGTCSATKSLQFALASTVMPPHLMPPLVLQCACGHGRRHRPLPQGGVQWQADGAQGVGKLGVR